MSLRFFTRVWWVAGGEDPIAQGRLGAIVGATIQQHLPKVPGVERVESVTTLNGEVGWEVLNQETQDKLAAFGALLAVAREADRQEDRDLGAGKMLWASLVALDAAHPNWREW